MRFFVYMYSGVVNFVMLVNRMSNIVSRNINVNAKGLAHRMKLIRSQNRSNIQYQLLENLLGKAKRMTRISKHLGLLRLL